jgi:hypothetical protein
LRVCISQQPEFKKFQSVQSGKKKIEVNCSNTLCYLAIYACYNCTIKLGAFTSKKQSRTRSEQNCLQTATYEEIQAISEELRKYYISNKHLVESTEP